MLEKSKNNEEFTKYSSKKVISSKKRERFLAERKIITILLGFVN